MPPSSISSAAAASPPDSAQAIANTSSTASASVSSRGAMRSSGTLFPELARQTAKYRAHLEETPAARRANPARGHVDIARLVYVAETDAIARRDSEPGILRHLSHFASGHTSGYLGTVQEKTVGSRTGYEALAHDIILHGSPATIAEKIAHLRDTARATSIMLHYPPWYGLATPPP